MLQETWDAPAGHSPRRLLLGVGRVLATIAMALVTWTLCALLAFAVAGLVRWLLLCLRERL